VIYYVNLSSRIFDFVSVFPTVVVAPVRGACQS
jgi:hypothetical protein